MTNCRIRLAFEAIFRKSATLQDVNPDPELGSGNISDRRESTENLNARPLTILTNPSKKVTLVSVN